MASSARADSRDAGPSIDPNGKILHIDKEVKPATSGEDMVAKLGELKTAKRSK